MGSRALVPPARHSRHGLFADRAFAARAALHAAASAAGIDRAAAWRDAGADRAGMAAAAGTDHRDSDGKQSAACARILRGVGDWIERRRFGATGPGISAAAQKNRFGHAQIQAAGWRAAGLEGAAEQRNSARLLRTRSVRLLPADLVRLWCRLVIAAGGIIRPANSVHYFGPLSRFSCSASNSNSGTGRPNR